MRYVLAGIAVCLVLVLAFGWPYIAQALGVLR